MGDWLGPVRGMEYDLAPTDFGFPPCTSAVSGLWIVGRCEVR